MDAPAKSDTEGMDAPPGTRARLFVVATPIGNLSDITLRALEILRSVPLVAAEDTRITRRLFARHGIGSPLVSYRERNAAAQRPRLLDHLRSGKDLALVSDAGTPMVSDPGEDLVAAWRSEGGPIVPVPGSSAVLGALVASGIAGPRWSFEGFLPRSGSERRRRLARIAADDRATILFEAPGRLPATLSDLAGVCGPDRVAAVCRELTKLHEETIRGTLGELTQRAASGGILLRGEFVVVVGTAGRGRVGFEGGTRRPFPGAQAEIEAARREVDRLTAGGLGRAAAARRVAAQTGLPRRQLYRGRASE